MSKLAITLVSIAILSATGVARADTDAGLQEQIANLQQEKTFLLNRLNRAIAYSKESRNSLENELAMRKQQSAKERQTLLRRIDRAKAYSRANSSNLESELAEQKEKSAKERQTLLRRIARAKAYSRANSGDLENEMALQKEKSAKERQTLLRRIARAKAYSRANSGNLENELAEQKEKSAKERQTLLRRIARAKAYSRTNSGNLENELALQKAKSAKERQTLLRRIDRTKAYSRERLKNQESNQNDWAVSTAATLDSALGGVQGTTVTNDIDNSVTVQVGNNGLFRTGSTALSTEGAQLLTIISQELSATDGRITILGHTDNVPVGSGSRFANNEELSFARASSTLNFLRTQGISTERLFAAGYGADRPIASNNSLEGRQQNRRVEIILTR